MRAVPLTRSTCTLHMYMQNCHCKHTDDSRWSDFPADRFSQTISFGCHVDLSRKSQKSQLPAAGHLVPRNAAVGSCNIHPSCCRAPSTQECSGGEL